MKALRRVERSPSLDNNFSPVSRLLATHLHPHSNFVLGRTPPLISTCVEVERYVAYLAWTVCALDSAPRGNSVDRPCLLLFRRHVGEQLLVFFIPGAKPFSPHHFYFLITKKNMTSSYKLSTSICHKCLEKFKMVSTGASFGIVSVKTSLI